MSAQHSPLTAVGGVLASATGGKLVYHETPARLRSFPDEYPMMLAFPELALQQQLAARHEFNRTT